jgi:hypothetical protein
MDWLSGVAAVSSDNVWAAGGSYHVPDGRNHTLIRHWDGTAWNVVPSPNNTALENSQLRGIVAVAPDDLWAVGESHTGSMINRPLVLHGDGHQWTIVNAPGDGQLYGVAASRPNDVWAVGYSAPAVLPLILHWNGSSWSITPVQPPTPPSHTGQLFEVAAVQPNHAWAVGRRFDGFMGIFRSLAYHWDGGKWSVFHSQ